LEAAEHRLALMQAPPELITLANVDPRHLLVGTYSAVPAWEQFLVDGDLVCSWHAPRRH
jgi:hypothetical protein